MKDVVIIGTGGHAKVIADIVVRAGDNLLGFLTSDRAKETFLEWPVLGRDTDITKYKEHYLFIAIGEPGHGSRSRSL